jgi:cyclopropane fatty-acyl-phospholipid synthase-like methyltransferase
MVGKIFFTFRYWLNNPPWDTGITPPEVYEFIKNHPSGNALDLGCGTGTNVITLAEHGWQTTGVDYIPKAIRTARRKIKRTGLEDRANFHVADVLTYQAQDVLFELILDIGCFHSFRDDDVKRYANNISSLLAPGGKLLLYVHLNLTLDPGHGVKNSDLAVLEEYLTLVKRQDGQESSRPSAWLEYQK